MDDKEAIEAAIRFMERKVIRVVRDPAGQRVVWGFATRILGG